ncbi:MAG: inositol monophosphatase family protein [Thermoproteota archaeon]
MPKYSEFIKEALRKCFEAVGKLDRETARRKISLNRFMDQTFEIDRVAEETIFEVARKFFSDGEVVSEESGVVRLGRGGPPFIIVDPIDGSVNASRGYPCYSSAIAVAEGEYLSSLVCSGVVNLLSGEVFLSERGEGAYLNSHRLTVSNRESVDEALIAIDLNVRRAAPGYLDRVSGILERAKYVRFLGTDALELCMVASGAADAFVDLRGSLRSIDFAAASLIIREAGGVVLDEKGRDLEVKLIPVSRSPIIAASSRRLAEQVLQIFWTGRGK